VIAIDTNVLLRYLLHDDELQARKATKLIHGDSLVFISHVVLAETVWTLAGKKYRVAPADIYRAIAALFAEDTIVIQEADVVWRALSDYKRYLVDKGVKIDFPDALILHTAQATAEYYEEPFDGFYTFDKAACTMEGATAP